MVFAFMCFLLMTLLFDVTPGRGAEVLSRAPQRQQAVLCLPEKTRVTETLSLLRACVAALLAGSSVLIQ